MQQVSLKQALKTKYPEPVVLVICCNKQGKANIITLGWSMQTSFDPPLLAISVGKTRYSHKLLLEIPEFVLCFPSRDMAKDVLYCGTHSGREVNKFEKTNLKSQPSKYIKPPLIENSVACFECKIVNRIETGDHSIFVGKVLASYINKKYKKRLYNFGNYRLKSIK